MTTDTFNTAQLAAIAAWEAAGGGHAGQEAGDAAYIAAGGTRMRRARTSTSYTALTPARAAALEFAAICDTHGRWDLIRNNLEHRAVYEALAPKRKPAFGDDVGNAMCSLRDWLRGGFAAPMSATVAEVRRALSLPA